MTHKLEANSGSPEVSSAELLAAAQERKAELFVWAKGYPARPNEMKEFERELRWDRAIASQLDALPTGFRRTLTQFLLPGRLEQRMVEPVQTEKRQDPTQSAYVLQQVAEARRKNVQALQVGAAVAGTRTTKELQPVGEQFLQEIEQFVSLYDGRTLPDDEYERGQKFVDRAPKVIADLLGRKKQTLVPLATHIEEAARVVEAMLKEQA